VSNLDLIRPVYSAYPLQRISHKSDLGFKLRLVSNMLKLASSAVTEILTARRAPRARRLQDSIDYPSSEGLLSLGNSNPQALTCGRVRNEDREPVVSRYCVASVRQALCGYVYEVSDPEQGGIHDLTIAGDTIPRKPAGRQPVSTGRVLFVGFP
jgi:hypothetical protein